MPVLLKHLVVQEPNKKSNERPFESMCVLLSHGDPLSAVSFLSQSIAGLTCMNRKLYVPLM